MEMEILAVVKPDPRFIWLINYAIEAITAQLRGQAKYIAWAEWGRRFKAGSYSPEDCVKVAHSCFAHRDDPIWHSLGQLAWAAKEACYSSPETGWLVVRYIADAMVAFGVAFPANSERLISMKQLRVVDKEAPE